MRRMGIVLLTIFIMASLAACAAKQAKRIANELLLKLGILLLPTDLITVTAHS